MTQPKFSVGEEVILQSKSNPKYSGEYIVERILSYNEIYTCRNSNKGLRNGCFGKPSYSYLFTEITIAEDGREWCWIESSLKKKYLPSDESFLEMMNSLKKGITA